MVFNFLQSLTFSLQNRFKSSDVLGRYFSIAFDFARHAIDFVFDFGHGVLEVRFLCEKLFEVLVVIGIGSRLFVEVKG